MNQQSTQQYFLLLNEVQVIMRFLFCLIANIPLRGSDLDANAQMLRMRFTNVTIKTRLTLITKCALRSRLLDMIKCTLMINIISNNGVPDTLVSFL